ncbi:MAG TPA: hypothetical protein VFO76_03880, partial [Candidatus Kapabacteria bacterium]|nr:hypothetical protein [Candidatus Kapabacteria bacterium]
TFSDLGHKLIINPGCKFDYYGVAPLSTSNTQYIGNSNLIGIGVIKLNGSIIGDNHYWITNTRLRIHGLSTLVIPDYYFLDGSDGMIQFWHEQSSDAKMSVHGKVSIYHSLVDAWTPSLESSSSPLPKTTLITVTSPLYSGSPALPNDEFIASGGTAFSPGNITGSDQTKWVFHANIDFKEDPISLAPYRKVNFDFVAMSWGITVVNPTHDFTFVNGSNISFVEGNMLDFTWSKSGNSYGSINISGSSFYHQGAPSGHAITFSDFSQRRSNDFDKITIENNSVSDNLSGSISGTKIFNAVNLVNTSALVKGNKIYDLGYKYGVLSTGASDNKSNSFLCSNSISSCVTNSVDEPGAGIFVRYWDGISKMNQVTGNDIGHIIAETPNVRPRILFSRYSENIFCGLSLNTQFSIIDLSGIHNDDDNYAAFDTIDHNNTFNSTNHAEIEARAFSMYMGTSNTGTSTFGRNSIVSDAYNMTNKLVRTNGTSTAFIGFNKNFWGYGTFTKYDLNQSNDPQPLINCPYPNPAEQENSAPSVGTTPSCGKGLDAPNNQEIGHKGGEVSFLTAEDEFDTCEVLATRGDNLSLNGDRLSYRKAYDTLRMYIEHCPFDSGRPPFGYAWRAFGSLNTCVSDMDTANDRWLEYRYWLKKVLYLNSDTAYYCADIFGLLQSFAYLVPGKGEDFNGIVSVLDFLIQNNRCPEQTKLFSEDRQNYRDRQWRAWKDNNDTTKVPIDTAKVSIDSIGFSILRGPEFAVVRTHPLNTMNFDQLYASRNPFTDETTLETTISDAMMLRLEVFDVLGKQVYSENEFFSSGDVRWKLNGKLLPKGSLYARVSTIGGSVRTVKLVRE